MREREGSGDECERKGGNGFVSANAETHNQRNASLLTVILQAEVCLQRDKKRIEGAPGEGFFIDDIWEWMTNSYINI